MKKLKYHTAANVFQMLDGDELTELADDIARNGLVVPILLDKSGRIIDGRNRYKACEMAGVEPRFETCDLDDDSEIMSLVWSLNEARRHLTTGQRIAAVANMSEILKKFKAEAKKRQKEAGKQHGRGKPKVNADSSAQTCADLSGPEKKASLSTNKTSSKMAALAGASARSFECAIAVKKKAPDLFKKIESGELTINAAYNRLRQRQKAQELSAKAEAARETASEQPPWLLINDDVMRGLQSVIDHHAPARLIFSDPPYNIGVDYGDGPDADKISDSDYMHWVRQWIDLSVQALSEDGSLWVMIGDEYAAEYAVALKDRGLSIRSWIKWYETFGVNCANNFNRTSRHIFYCVVDPNNFVFHSHAVTRPSDRQTKYNDKRAAANGKIWDDVWTIPRLTGTSKERVPGVPTQLPLQLVSAIVGCASDPGDLVVDPFNGSGTTGVAALRLDRKYIGIDRSAKYVEISEQRLIGEWR